MHNDRKTRRWAAFVSTILAAAFAASLYAQSPQHKTGTRMKEFALLFRQGTRKLTPEEQQQRGEKVRAWAIDLVGKEILTFSRLLGEEIRQTADGEKHEPVGAFTIVRAESLDDAFKLAKTFPGIEYGVSVEVREATNPAAPPQE